MVDLFNRPTMCPIHHLPADADGGLEPLSQGQQREDTVRRDVRTDIEVAKCNSQFAISVQSDRLQAATHNLHS